MKKLAVVLALGLSAGVSLEASAAPLTQCPIVGAATSCAVLYTFNADGSVSTTVDSTIASTDDIEDTLVGIQNNSGHTINSLSLSGVGINFLGIFDFDGDGVSNVPNPGSGPGATYFGEYFKADGTKIGTTTFSNIGPGGQSGTIDFAGLLNGGYGWFVLEDQISFTKPPVVTSTPLPAALPLLASVFGIGGLVRRRALSKLA